MSAFRSWWSGLLAEPLTLVAAVAIVVVSLVASARLLPRLPGPLWRACWIVLATGYAATLLAFIAPPPERGVGDRSVLVTTGTTAAVLDTVSDGSDVFVTGRAWQEPAVAVWLKTRAGRAATGRAIRVAGLDDLPLYGPVPASLRVTGYGLDGADWAAAGWSGAIEFAPPELPAGLTRVTWPRQTVAGRGMTVIAEAAEDMPAGAMLVLRDTQGAALVSAPVADARLKGPVLPSGRHVLRLSLEADGVESDAIDIAVDVREPLAARVLLLQSAPSFEWRSLGRWLVRAGAAVATRTRVSKARFRDRFQGLAARDLGVLDAALIADFDLVIIDGAALGDLDAGSRSLLLDEQSDTGVLVLVHDPADLAPLTPRLRDALQGDPDRVAVYQLAESLGVLDTGLTRLGLSFTDASGEALLQSAAGDAIVARATPGDAVALALLRDSYRLVGVGAGAGHASLWSGLVQDLARDAEPRHAQFWPEATRVGERLRVCLPRSAGVADVMLRQSDGPDTVLTLLTTPWRPAQRCGWVWPDHEGWLLVTTGADATSELGAHWVAPYGPLSRIEQQRRIEATQRQQRSGTTVPPDAGSRAVAMPRSKLLPAVLLFAVLLALTERLAMARRRRIARAADRS